MAHNMRKWLKPRTILLFTLMLDCQLPLQAQQDVAQQGPQWYQVELLIFERRLTGGNGPDAERWPRNIALAYPPNVRYLMDPSDEQESDVPDSAGLDMASRQEQPYRPLDKSGLQLADSARGIQRDPNLRLLFHKTWRQPMVASPQAPAIVISGGEQYDQHHELEGTVTFSVSRYLHMHTNLWLTQFESNYGQAIGQWPPLPRKPAKPGELASDEFARNIDVPVTEPQTIYSPWGSDAGNTGEGSFNLNQNDSFQLNNYGYLSQQPFVTKNIVLVQQQRRMRSNELHYVDHPRLGILVLITSYDHQTGTVPPR